MRSPRIARWLVRRWAPADQDEELIGDLEEAHAARLARRNRAWATVLTGIEAIDIARGFLLERWGHSMRGGLMSGPETRLALRVTLRSPVMTLTSVFTLAVGITLATTGYTVIDAILHPVLPFENGDRWVEIRLLDEERRESRALEPGLYAAIREGASALEHVGAFRAVPLNVEYATGTIELGSGGLITPATFEHLPFRPLVGRPLIRLDGERNAPAVVVIRESLWDRRLGRDPNVVGQRLSVGGELRTVVGVLPDDATFPLQAEIWLPLQSAVLEDQRAMFGDVQLMGVLSAGATVESAEQQLGTRAANWRSQHADVEPLAVSIRRTGEIRGASAPGGLLVAMLIGLVIVVAGNVANLVIARTASRRNELAVRTALGAARSRLVAQLSLEVLLVGAIAAGIGLWTSQYILRHLVQSEAEDIPVWVDLGVSPRVFLFVVAIALLVTVVAGLMPALRATRGDVSQTLRGGRSASSRMFGRFDDAMIVAQIALSIGILGAATMIHKGWMQGYGGRDLPIPSNEVLLATIAFAGGAAPLPQDSLTLLRERIETALAQVPGVLGAGTSTHMPGSDAPAQNFIVEAAQGSSADDIHRLPAARVGPTFFASLDVAPLAGRLFLIEDYAMGAAPVVLVNQPFVDRVLGGANVIGRRIRLAEPGRTDAPWSEIVGVVPDLGLSGADPASAGGVYLPLRGASEFRLLLRASGPPLALTPSVQRALFDVDSDIVMSDVRVLATELKLLRRVYLFIGSAFTSIGGIVLLLSLTALYAILSFEVTRRTREIGVRIALGATHRTILLAVLRRVMISVALAAALGILLGVGLLTAARAAFVMRFPPTGALTFVALTAATAISAVAAVFVPALRAVRVVPMDELRAD